MSAVERLLNRLDQVIKTGKDQFRSRCPAHGSRGRTLSIKELGDGRVLIHCFAGCSPSKVMNTIGLGLSDLYEGGIDDRVRPLYMARQQVKWQADINEQISSYEIRLEMADEMRRQGVKLTEQDLQGERDAFMKIRSLKGEQK